MFVVPVPADEFLPFVIRAIQANGYVGLFIVLARTADAREQHEELTRDWTSIHDVTGPLVAVLCPDPRTLRSAVVYDRSISTGISAEGLVSGTWQFDPRDAAAIEALISHYRDRGVQAARPFSARAHQDAWSEATSRCARYFGVPEGLLPSLLVLSYLDRSATLISLGGDTSIYALCKSVVNRLGTLPDDLMRTREAQQAAVSRWSRLRDDSSAWDKRQRAVMLPYAEWHEQIVSLDRHIARLEGLLPDLVVQARSSLARLMADEAAGPEVCGQLRILDKAINTPDFNGADIPIRRIHTKIWKVVRKLEADPKAHPLPERVNPYRSPVASAEAEIERLKLLVQQQTSSLQFSKAVRESVRNLHRVEESHEPQPIRHLQDWELRIFRQLGRADPPLRRPPL
jgi:hypothetical protein